MRRAASLAVIIAAIVASAVFLIAGITLTVISFGFSSGIQSSSATVTGPGAAILTDVVGTRRSIPGAQVVLRVESASGKAAFLGVAKPPAVDRFLAGVAYDVVTSLDGSTPNGNMRSVPGSDTAPNPTTSTIWDASAQSAAGLNASARLVWNLDETGRALVLMNADGSSDVSVRVITLISIATPGWRIVSISLIGLGVLLLIVAVIALRRLRHGPPPTPQHAASTRRWFRRRETSAADEPEQQPVIEVSGVDTAE